jgi:YVTN family beta-propeller protein
MNFRISGLLAIAAFALAGLFGNAQSFAQHAYITNEGSNTVSVIATASNTVTAMIALPGSLTYGVAVNRDGSKVYVTNNIGNNSVSVIDTASNTVTTIPVGDDPEAWR